MQYKDIQKQKQASLRPKYGVWWEAQKTWVRARQKEADIANFQFRFLFFFPSNNRTMPLDQDTPALHTTVATRSAPHCPRYQHQCRMPTPVPWAARACRLQPTCTHEYQPHTHTSSPVQTALALDHDAPVLPQRRVLLPISPDHAPATNANAVFPLWCHEPLTRAGFSHHMHTRIPHTNPTQTHHRQCKRH